MADKTALLKEYNLLLERRRSGKLSSAGEQRLELLQDVLLELGALPTSEESGPVRRVRADVVLEVSFSTADEVVRAYSKNIGPGGIAIRTSREYAVGTTMELRIRVPNAAAPIVVEGKVAWAKPDSAGISFGTLRPEDDRLLKELLVSNTSVLKRIQRILKTDVRAVGNALTADVTGGGHGMDPARAQEVDTRPLVLVRVADRHLCDVTCELLQQTGVRVSTDPLVDPAIIAADAEHAVNVIRPSIPLVLIGVSGPDSLAGQLLQLKPAAFVKKPVTAAAIAQVVGRLLQIESPGASDR